MTEFHDYNVPERGQTNWHEPLNENFRQIDRDVEIRAAETAREQYDPVNGAKFLATDTGRAYVGDGSQWRLLKPVGAAGTPGIICYENGETGYAETPMQTFSGACIFEAAQQAINAQIDAENGNIDLFVEQGEYDLTTGIQIPTTGLRRVQIRSPEWNQVKLNTSEITDQSFVIEVDPGPIRDGGYSQRGQKIAISGFELDDSGREDRAIGGIYVNDYESLIVSNHSIYGGFERGLWLRNIWQGKVDTVEVFECGSDTASVPAIQVGHRDDTATHQAINHIQFNHLQGGPRTEYAYFEARGKATRLDIEYPNAELAGNRGFVFDGSNGHMRGQVRGAQLTDGAPAIEIKEGAHLQIFGGSISGEPTAITAAGSGVPKLLVGGGIRLTGTDDGPAVELGNAWVTLSNFHISHGRRGLVANNCGMANVSNGTIRGSSQAGLELTNASARTYSLSNLNFVNTATDGASPIILQNVHNTYLDGIFAHSSSAVPAISIESGHNVAIENVLPVGAVTDVARADSNTSFRQNGGTATIARGTNSVSVTHGLSAAPALQDITVVPNDSLGTATTWYVTNIESDSFDIQLDTATDGSVRFGWQASV